MAKKVTIQMNPFMKEVGTKIINPTPAFNEEEYEKALVHIAKNAEIKILDFGDIDDIDDIPANTFDSSSEIKSVNANLDSSLDSISLPTYKATVTSTDEVLTGFERGFSNESPTIPERGFSNEGPIVSERGFNNESPTVSERGFSNEGPAMHERGFDNESPVNLERAIKTEGPTNSGTGFKDESSTKKKGAYLIEIDINLIEREKLPIDCIRLEAVVRSFYKKKQKKDEWVQLSREMLQVNKINGARLKETRFICRNRGIIDFKIENEGVQGKERTLYKLV